MRKQPEVKPPSISYRISEQVEQQQRRYRIITPLFGGGAIDHTCDEITVVRGTEIRGHLHFWWRATCTGHLLDIDAVKQREDLIWGKAHIQKEPGPKRDQTVQIEVSIQKEPEPIAPYFIETTLDNYNRKKNREKHDKGSRISSYVAFPLMHDQKTLENMPYLPPRKKKSGKAISQAGIEFTLTITFPRDYSSDIERALWAWETFGGIGARTRRGFGALELLDINGEKPTNKNQAPSPQDAEAWLKGNLKDLPINKHGFPYIGPDMRFQPLDLETTDAIQVWKTLIEKLFQFRQGSFGRRHRMVGNQDKAGRSYWPEAETIRDLTGQRHPDHPAQGLPHKFPRAAFGLPILFHFAKKKKRDSDKNNPTKEEPVEVMLQPEGENNRLASPLILKPLPCQNGQVCGLALILRGYTIPRLHITWKDKAEKVDHQLTDKDLSKLSSLKLNNVDVLQAFLDYLDNGSKRKQ